MMKKQKRKALREGRRRRMSRTKREGCLSWSLKERQNSWR